MRIVAERSDDAMAAARAASIAAAAGLAATSELAVASERRVEGDADADELELRVGAASLRLCGVGRPYAVDFGRLDVSSGPGRSLKTPLRRAAGVRSGVPRPGVIDATAGWGEDAWLLAAAGCAVTMIERNPIVAAMLAEGLAAARGDASDAMREIAGRLTLVEGDSSQVLAGMRADVVLVDPMFPDASTRTTAARKPMRLLRMVIDACAGASGADADADCDEQRLLRAAGDAADRRLVVKRPRACAPAAIEGWRLSGAHTGRGYRFDVYSRR